MIALMAVFSSLDFGTDTQWQHQSSYPMAILMQGINNFCREIGITRTGGELPLHILDFHVRADLHLTSPRTLAVLRPLKVVITNLPDDHLEMVEAKASCFTVFSAVLFCHLNILSHSLLHMTSTWTVLFTKTLLLLPCSPNGSMAASCCKFRVHCE